MTKWVKRFALLFVLLMGAGWVAKQFWGNPWVRLTMGGQVTDYLRDRYPQTRFAVTDTAYDFLNRRYIARVRTQTSPVVQATVEVYRTGHLADDYPKQKVAAEMVAQLTPVVQGVLPEAAVSARAILPDGVEYGEGIAYGPAVEGELHASVNWDLASGEPEPFVEQAAAVLAALRQSGLRVDSCLFWGDLGDRSYALDLSGNQMALSNNELLLLVSKPGKW